MQHSTLLVIFGVLLCLVPGRASAQQAVDGAVNPAPPAPVLVPSHQGPVPPPSLPLIQSIEIHTSELPPVSQATLRAKLAFKEGDRYDDKAVEQSIRNLYMTGLVDEVDIKDQDIAGGKKVVVSVAFARTIAEASFTGNASKDPQVLLAASGLAVGQPVDQQVLNHAGQAVLDLYHADGFSEAVISLKADSLPENQAKIVMTIKEGTRWQIRNISFPGSVSVRPEVLLEKIDQKPMTPRRPAEVEASDMSNIHGVYADLGYIYANVTRVELTPCEDQGWYDLAFVVVEGDLYTVQSTKIDGNKVLPTEKLQGMLKTKQAALCMAASIREDEKTLGDTYGALGYADARIETSVIPAKARTVRVEFKVIEGEKFTIGKINVAGNTVTRSQVIRAEAEELGIKAGGVLNTVGCDRLVQALKSLTFFSECDLRWNPSGVPGIKDLDIAVTEKGAGRVDYGAQWSTIDGVSFKAGFHNPNFGMSWPGFAGDGTGFDLDFSLAPGSGSVSLKIARRDFLGMPLHLKLPAAAGNKPSESPGEP